MQQVPSSEKSIRMLFKASKNNTLVGSDFSQQEPRILSAFSQDENMINAYKSGKDLYAMIASGVYHNKYEDNLEHYSDGSINVEGKKRRSNCKKILLGIMYGRGVASIAEQIGESYEEAQKIIDNFYSSFPKVKKWMDETEKNAKKDGYVEDLWGRRRRLPEIKLPKYEIIDKNKGKNNFNPLLNCKDKTTESKEVKKYKEKLSKIKTKNEFESLKKEASKESIEIINNSSYISQAERQCINARIQGAAASMTKQAMLNIYNDEELNALGFKLAINVHDELIGECPKINAEKVAKRLEDVMKNSAKDVCDVPFKCDADISERWYYNDYCAEIQEEYAEKLKELDNKDKALNFIINNHAECTKEKILKILENSQIN